MFLAALLSLSLRTEEMFLCCWHEQNNVNWSHVIHDRSTQAVRVDGCPSLSVTVWTGRFSVKLLQQNKLCLRDDFCRTVQMVVVFQGAWRQRNTHLQVEPEVCGVCGYVWLKRDLRNEMWGRTAFWAAHLIHKPETPTQCCWYISRPTTKCSKWKKCFLVFFWCWKKTHHKTVSFVC